MEGALARLELLIGDKIELLKHTKVLVIGLGGVGGYAIEALTRLGIGAFVLVDGDSIEPSNLNRQLIATTDTIGILKTKAWQKRISKISPEAEVTLISKMISKDEVADLFLDHVDYVIDACDTIATKKELIKYCTRHHIPMISSMGMGKRLDPTKIEVVDIRKTSYDPMAKVIRKMVRDEGIKDRVMVVSSREAPKKGSGTVIASNAIIPSIAGLLCANYILDDILKR